MNVKVLTRFTWQDNEYLVQGDFDANGDRIAMMMDVCKGVDIFALGGAAVLDEYNGDLEAANCGGSFLFLTYA